MRVFRVKNTCLGVPTASGGIIWGALLEPRIMSPTVPSANRKLLPNKHVTESYSVTLPCSRLLRVYLAGSSQHIKHPSGSNSAKSGGMEAASLDFLSQFRTLDPKAESQPEEATWYLVAVRSLLNVMYCNETKKVRRLPSQHQAQAKQFPSYTESQLQGCLWQQKRSYNDGSRRPS
jgi:hypothetical protein